MSDPAVVECVLAGFATLRFPPPANGTVTVTYPLLFAPEEQGAPSPPGIAGPAPVVPGVVRLHVDSPVEAELVEHMGARDIEYHSYKTQWTELNRRVCVTPCDVVIDGRTQHSFTLTSPQAKAPPTWTGAF